MTLQPSAGAVSNTGGHMLRASARTIAIRRAACPFPGLFKLVVEMAPGVPSASVTRCVFVHAERNCGAVRSSTDFERVPTAVRTALFRHGYPFSSYWNLNTARSG